MSDLQQVIERNKRRAEKREERRKRKGVECNMCCTDEETGTPGCVEESCKAICDKCPKCPTDNKMAKVVPKDGSPETLEMQRGGRKTRRKRRKKRRKSRKNRKKTKRRRKRRRKKSKKVRRK